MTHDDIRRILLAAVTEEDIAKMVRILLAKAKKGDVAACELLWSYTIGPPLDAAQGGDGPVKTLLAGIMELTFEEECEVARRLEEECEMMRRRVAIEAAAQPKGDLKRWL